MADSPEQVTNVTTTTVTPHVSATLNDTVPLNFKEFIDKHFDKLLLSFMIYLMTGVVLYLVFRKVDAGTITWATGAYSTFVGALVGLITGGRWAMRKTDSNGNGTSTTIETTKKD